MSENLEIRLGRILYENDLEDTSFNEAYTNIISLMKKVAKDKKYQEQLKKIETEDEKILGNESLGEYFTKIRKLNEKRFGLKSTLTHILWEGQVPKENFNKLFKKITSMMKKIVKDKDYQKQLYNIDLNYYKDEE